MTELETPTIRVDDELAIRLDTVQHPAECCSICQEPAEQMGKFVLRLQEDMRNYLCWSCVRQALEAYILDQA